MSVQAVTGRQGLSRIHLLLAVQSVVIVLGSINRLTSLTLGYVAANEFLRWVDLLNMLVIPLISLVASYLLKKQLETNPRMGSAAWPVILSAVFIIGVYLTAASYGDHEVTNYLHARFCTPDDGNALCRIVIYNDDEFSHFVFFTGFVLVNAALLFFQVVFPHPGTLTRRDIALLVFNGLFIGVGIFANLAFEEIGLDLYVVLILTALAVALIWRRGRQPLFVYYTTAYVLGFIATLLYKLVAG